MNFQNLLNQLDSLGFQVLSTLLSVLWQSTILLLAAGTLAYFLRHRSAAARHAVWTAAVLAIPLLPLLSPEEARWSPVAKVTVMPEYKASRSANPPAATVDRSHAASAPEAKAPAGTKSFSASTPPAPVPSTPRSIGDYPWALGLAGYLAAVSAFLLWTLAGRLRIRRWILGGSPVHEAHTLDVFAEAGERLGLTREIFLLEHPDIPAPFVCRVLRPVVVLPEGFSGNLTDFELRAAALHELAHVRRRDTLSFTAIVLLRAVFFFQPLLWLAARRISWLAEVSCDSAALEYGGDPASYAGFLSRMASGLPAREMSAGMAAGILFSRSAFFRRVREILSGRGVRLPKPSPAVLAGTMLCGAVAFMAAISCPLASAGAHKDGYWLEGRIVDTEGRPIEGASFYVTWEIPGKKTMDSVGIRKTKRDGRFRLDGIGVRIVNRNFLHHKLYGSYHFPYLETNRFHTFVLQKPEGFISGRVVDERGKPMKHASVSVAGVPNIGPTGFLNGISTSGDNKFQLKVLKASESYRVIASCHEFRKNGPNVYREGYLDVPNHAEGITIVLRDKDSLSSNISPEMKQRYDYYESKRGTAVPGTAAPELAVSRWVQGTPVELSSLRGKATVLFFWDKDSLGAVRPLTLLDYWRRNYGGRGVEFIAVHSHTADIETVRKMAEERTGGVPCVVDSKSPVPGAQGETFNRYGVISDHYPRIIVIDREGRVAFRGPQLLPGGFIDPEEIESEIRRLLDGNT